MKILWIFIIYFSTCDQTNAADFVVLEPMLKIGKTGLKTVLCEIPFVRKIIEDVRNFLKMKPYCHSMVVDAIDGVFGTVDKGIKGFEKEFLHINNNKPNHGNKIPKGGAQGDNKNKDQTGFLGDIEEVADDVFNKGVHGIEDVLHLDHATVKPDTGKPSQGHKPKDDTQDVNKNQEQNGILGNIQGVADGLFDGFNKGLEGIENALHLDKATAQAEKEHAATKPVKHATTKKPKKHTATTVKAEETDINKNQEQNGIVGNIQGVADGLFDGFNKGLKGIENALHLDKVTPQAGKEHATPKTVKQATSKKPKKHTATPVKTEETEATTITNEEPDDTNSDEQSGATDATNEQQLDANGEEINDTSTNIEETDDTSTNIEETDDTDTTDEQQVETTASKEENDDTNTGDEQVETTATNKESESTTKEDMIHAMIDKLENGLDEADKILS